MKGCERDRDLGGFRIQAEGLFVFRQGGVQGALLLQERALHEMIVGIRLRPRRVVHADGRSIRHPAGQCRTGRGEHGNHQNN
jgi:hypothetical protein